MHLFGISSVQLYSELISNSLFDRMLEAAFVVHGVFY